MPARSPQIDVVREYFHRVDAASPTVLELFAENFEFYFPKYGFGRGAEEFIQFGLRFREEYAATHDKDNLRFSQDGNRVFCEGVTFGVDAKGNAWAGGETAGGRFCSIYELVDNKIISMRIYLDPDYTAQDRARLIWGADRRW